MLFKMPGFQQILQNVQRRSKPIFRKKRQAIQTDSKGAQMLDLTDTDFKSAITNKFTELKETMYKELERSMMTMFQQIENINKDKEITEKKQQIEILELYHN